MEKIDERIKEILTNENVIKGNEYEGGKIYLTENYLLWETKNTKKSESAIIPRDSILKLKEVGKFRKGTGLEVTCGEDKLFFPFQTRTVFKRNQRDMYEECIQNIHFWIATIERGVPPGFEKWLAKGKKREEIKEKRDQKEKRRDQREEVKYAPWIAEIEELIRELRSKSRAKDAKVREEILNKLEEGEEVLIPALKDASQEFRMEAVRSLAFIEEVKKNGKAIEPLIDVLKNDEDPNIRALTAEVLAFLKDPRAIDALIQALDDTGATSEGPSTFGFQFGKRVQQMAAHALAKQGDKRGIAAMVPRVLEESWWDVGYTAEVFKHVGQPAVEYLIQGLKIESQEARKRAIKALDKLNWGAKFGESAVEPLIQALKDEDYSVRVKAARALGNIKNPKATQPLIQILKGDEEVNSRQAAANALGEIGDARAIEALIQAKEDKSWFVRDAAKGALKKIKKSQKKDKSVCKNCGFKNKQDSMFCENCGAKLE